LERLLMSDEPDHRSDWLLEPPGPEDYRIAIAVGDLTALPAHIGEAVEQLLKAVEEADEVFGGETPQSCGRFGCGHYGKCDPKCGGYGVCRPLLFAESGESADER
jgi:hypothetical protein